jgi:hypothetical protein
MHLGLGELIVTNHIQTHFDTYKVRELIRPDTVRDECV